MDENEIIQKIETPYDKADAEYLNKKYNIKVDLTPVWISKYMCISKTRADYYKIKETHKEYGMSFVNGQNLKHSKGQGSKSKKRGGSSGKGKKRQKFIPPPFNIEDLHKFNYEKMLNSIEDKKFNKIKRVKFEHRFYKQEQIDMYKRIEARYYEDMENGTIDIISSFVKRLSTYMRDNGLSIDKNKENFIDGSVICNIALMISKYLKKGIFDTDIEWINKLKIAELNDFDNIYVLFLLLQIFSCKQRYKKQYINGVYIRDWWAICLIRRRDKNEDTRTLGILPRFTKDEYGETIYELY